MIYQLMRNDPAWKFLPLAAAGGALVLLHHNFGLVVVGGVSFVFAIQSQPGHRVTLFRAALPIPARQIFLARMLSLLALVWLPALVALALVSFTADAGHRIGAVLAPALLMTLAVLVTLSMRLRGFASPRWCLSFYIVAFAAGPLAQLWPAGVSAACAAAGIGVFLAAWRGVPLAFQIAAAEVTADHTSQGRSGTRAAGWWSVFRWSISWRAIVIAIAPLSQALTGNWMYGILVSLIGFTVGRLRFGWLDPLPIGRWRLLLATVLPAMVAVVAGYLLSPEILVASRLSVLLAPSNGTPSVETPLAFWRVAQGGRAPLAESPWGETTQPETSHLAGLSFYNPYFVGPANSRRFLDWQLRRATEDVYGRAIPLSKFRGTQGVPRSATRPPGKQMLMAVFIIVCILAVYGMAGMNEWRRTNQLSAWIRNLPFGLVAAVLAIDFVRLGMLRPPVIAALVEGIMLRLSRLPGNQLAVVAVAAVSLVAVAYLALLKQFQESEFKAKAAPMMGGSC